jgi:4-hydroxy-tetrahydrodipicolinate synthase
MPKIAAEIRNRLERGLVSAVPVPRRADGSLHEAAQEAYVAWMRQQPVAGVAVWVHTGRGLLIPPEMRRQVLRSWRAGLGAGRLVVAGAGALPSAPDYDGAAAAMAAEAAELGADALLCFAPTPYRHDPTAIVRYHERLSGAGLPLFLFYLYEAAGGVSYSLDVLRELFDSPSVAGIKMATLDSVMTYQEVAALIAAQFPETLLVTGEDRFLGYSLQLGARAALIGMGAAVPVPQAALIGRAPEEDPAAFLRLSRAADDFARHTFRAPMEGYIRRMLWALADTGVIPEEATHDPEGPELEAWEREEVRRATLRFAAIA